MIVDCAIYRDGRREDVSEDLGEAFRRSRTVQDSFIWVGLREPSTEEFDRVSREFSLHPLAVEDAVHAHQRPKLERYGESLFLVLKTLRYMEPTSSVEIGEIMLFVGEGFVVTVRHGAANPLGPVRRRLEGEERVLRQGPPAVLYTVCDQVVDTYGQVAAEIEQDVEEVEQSVFSATRTNDAERIYLLKREVLALRRAVVPLAAPMHALTEGASLVDDETRPFFRDVTDHVLRVSEQVETFDDLLTSVLNANLAQVGVQQNADMRRISAWVAIFAAPTLLAGIWGMNFSNMPELAWNYGYFAALAFMAVVCYVLYRLFRRSGWL